MASVAPVRPGRRRAPARQLGQYLRRRVLPSDRFVLALLVLAVAAVAVLVVRMGPWVPVSALGLLVLVGGFVLTRRSLGVLLAATAVALLVVLVLRGPAAVLPGAAVVTAVAVLVLRFGRTREVLGVQGSRGESMLVDLRDRLRAQGELPALPAGWEAEVVLRNAYGASFSGDFLVATRSDDERWLELVLVDVSGKGLAAATRALLLCGAFGGLLGAMPPEEFLPAANRYLLRQHWDEGFATAAHLSVDLDTGDYRIASAGHPPLVQFLAGSGRWQLAEAAAGPLLGVLPHARFAPQQGRLDRGDALLLYTDGLVETPGRDLSWGIDRLVGEAERLVTSGFRHGAHALVDAVGVGEGDDRALLLIWRN